MKDLINILDLSVEEIDDLIRVAEDIMKTPEKYADVCKGKILELNLKSWFMMLSKLSIMLVDWSAYL